MVESARPPRVLIYFQIASLLREPHELTLTNVSYGAPEYAPSYVIFMAGMRRLLRPKPATHLKKSIRSTCPFNRAARVLG